MTIQTRGFLAMAASVVLASAAFGADPVVVAPTEPAAPSAVSETEPKKADEKSSPAPEPKAAPASGPGIAAMSPEERMEAGKKAVQATCVDGGCHAPEKWMGAAWDRENWAITLDAMFEKMVEYEKPVPPPATYNLLLDYLAATYGQ